MSRALNEFSYTGIVFFGYGFFKFFLSGDFTDSNLISPMLINSQKI